MAKTRRDKLRHQVKYNTFRSEWYKTLSYKEQVIIFAGFNKNPGWWNHIYTIRKNRRETRKLLHIIIMNPSNDLLDEIVFPVNNKPTLWFW